MSFSISDIPSLKVTVMGLGLNNGGTETARFFARHGAKVTVTDLRTAETLAPSLEKLKDFNITYVLGEHKNEDFSEADLVIKNPAVRADSPFLARAKRVETDISIFLSLCRNPVLAVTGSKGKSTVVSALDHLMSETFPDVKTGGNITVNPLSFLSELLDGPGNTPVILELSSWQLADLRNKGAFNPKIAVVTNLMKDHQNYYDSMETYAADKAEIFWNQAGDSYTIVNYDDPWGRRFYIQTPAQPLFVSRETIPKICDGGFLREDKGILIIKGEEKLLFSGNLRIRGLHNRLNLLFAGITAYLSGVPACVIERRSASFTGIAHRLEDIACVRGVNFVNDSAATIPEAVSAALESFSGPLHLIAGGTDKNLDFSPLKTVLGGLKGIYLLSGTATDKLMPVVKDSGCPYFGPYNSLKEAVEESFKNAREGDTVLLSPGCTSFGMFLNEFDRGNKFKEIALSLNKEI